MKSTRVYLHFYHLSVIWVLDLPSLGSNPTLSPIRRIPRPLTRDKASFNKAEKKALSMMICLFSTVVCWKSSNLSLRPYRMILFS